MTLQHKSNNIKHKLRTIDFKRDKTNIPGRVIRIQYDPNHRLYLALIRYTDGEERYILAPQGLEVGDVVKAGDKAELRPGDALPIGRIPVGTLIHNIELQRGKGGQLVRIAGGAAKLFSKDSRYVQVLLPSGVKRPIPVDCLATIGRILSIPGQKTEAVKAQPQKQLEPLPAKVAKEEKPAIVVEIQQVTLVSNARLTISTNQISVLPGQIADFSVTANNTGNTVWRKANACCLGWRHSYELFPNNQQFLKLNLDEGEEIPPGASRTWNITGLNLPEKPGTYTLTYQMIKADEEWFGEPVTISIIVKEAPVPEPSLLVNPIIMVLPPSGLPGDIFKVSIAGCTPRHNVTIHGEKYSLSSGWQPWYKRCKTDNQGRASTNISWRYKGKYDIWVVDEATNVKAKANTVVVQYPPVKLALEVSPSSGPAGSLFKITIHGGTPKHKVSLHGQKYTPSAGWQLWYKGCKANQHGKASLNLSWRYKGEYNLWAIDEATGVETQSVTVVVR